MRFLLDQDVYADTAAFLRAEGHDIQTAADRRMSQADDADLLRAAQTDGRIFLTHDRDLGGLVFVSGAGYGVIYMRVPFPVLTATHAELKTVLATYTEADLLDAFVVVEPGGHRIRRPTP